MPKRAHSIVIGSSPRRHSAMNAIFSSTTQVSFHGIGKGWCSIAIGEQTRRQRAEPDLWLVFAPVKRARIDYLVEKATELGVAELHPVWTARTIVERINLERLQANAIEAAEQTERLAVPRVEPPEKLPTLLGRWKATRRLIVCDERGRAPPIAEIVLGLRDAITGGAAMLVGPEGGFTETELRSEEHTSELQSRSD